MGITRACGMGSQSEHKEGRAWDWGITPSNPAAQKLLQWLLATDEYGNTYAMVRRFGIMYIIFDRTWWTATYPERGWQAYSGENPHLDHVHLSFSWDGALQKTSYWKGPFKEAINPFAEKLIQKEDDPSTQPQPQQQQNSQGPQLSGGCHLAAPSQISHLHLFPPLWLFLILFILKKSDEARNAIWNR